MAQQMLLLSGWLKLLTNKPNPYETTAQIPDEPGGRRVSYPLSAQSTAVNLHASAVDVSYAVSGSEGDWTFDFSVTNNITAGHHIYFFGVKMSARDIVGSPSGFDPDAWASWDNTPYGGSVSDYNNNLYMLHNPCLIMTA